MGEAKPNGLSVPLNIPPKTVSLVLYPSCLVQYAQRDLSFFDLSFDGSEAYGSLTVTTTDGRIPQAGADWATSLWPISCYVKLLSGRD